MGEGAQIQPFYKNTVVPTFIDIGFANKTLKCLESCLGVINCVVGTLGGVRTRMGP